MDLAHPDDVPGLGRRLAPGLLNLLPIFLSSNHLQLRRSSLRHLAPSFRAALEAELPGVAAVPSPPLGGRQSDRSARVLLHAGARPLGLHDAALGRLGRQRFSRLLGVGPDRRHAKDSF